MKGFYATGGNGTFVQTEDGRYVDTVGGDTNVEGQEALHEKAAALAAEITDYVDIATVEEWGFWDNDQCDILEYVGA